MPADWGTKDFTWTLVANGRTEKAFGTLEAIWEIDRELMIKNLGRASANLDAAGRDEAPTVTVKPVPSVGAGQSVMLTVTLADDGLPPVRARRAEGEQAGEASRYMNAPLPTIPDPPPGLWLLWQQYRGPGTVAFEPAGYQSAEARGGTLSTTARFSEPGTYVLRALASDSLLDSSQDVTVTVGPGAARQGR